MNQTASPAGADDPERAAKYGYHRPFKALRKCLSCGTRLAHGTPAIRVSENNGRHTNNAGALRFWLCRTCADVIEATLEKRRAS